MKELAENESKFNEFVVLLEREFVCIFVRMND